MFIYLQGYLRKYLQWYNTIITRWPQQAKILVCFGGNKWYLLKVLYVCIHFVILRAHLIQELWLSGLSCNIYSSYMYVSKLWIKLCPRDSEEYEPIPTLCIPIQRNFALASSVTLGFSLYMLYHPHNSVWEPRGPLSAYRIVAGNIVSISTTFWYR